jgi:hypothetical protein
MNADLARWLHKATRGLPADAAEMVREEIEAHYDDARRDHLLTGLSPEDAHIAAMRELGDVEATAGGLRHTHLADRRYLKAGLLGVAYALGYLLLLPLNHLLGGDLGFNPANFLFVLYIAHSFKLIASDRFTTRPVHFYTTMVARGIVVVCVTRLLGWIIFHNPTITESYSRTLWDTVSQWEYLLNLLSLSGLLLVAISLLVLAEQALHLHSSFYGLLRVIIGGVTVCGLGLAVFGVTSTYGIMEISLISGNIMLLTGLAVTVLWSFVFLRAGTRQEVYNA